MADQPAPPDNATAAVPPLPPVEPPAVHVSASIARETLPRSRTLAWLRRFAKLWGFALFCVFVVYTFREVALPFLFAVLVAYILSPLVDRFERLKIRGRPFPRGLAVVILYINIIAILSVFIGYFVPKLSSDFARMFREAPQMIARVNREWVPRAGAWIDERFATEDATAVADSAGPDDGRDEPDTVEPPTRAAAAEARQQLLIEPLPDGKMRVDLQSVQLEVRPASEGGYIISAVRPEAVENAGVGKWERSIKHWIAERLKSTEGETRRALEWGQKFVAAVVGGVARLVLVLMVAAFILVDMVRIRAFLRSLVPTQYETDYDRIIVGVDRGLSGVIRGQLVICLINGVFTYAGLLLFRVKYPLLLAGLASVMSLIPIFGSVLSSIPIVAIAVISSGSFDILTGLKVLAWIVGIHQVEANFLNPKIMGDSAKIHPVLVIFALIAGEHSYGLVGALFAVPVASIIQTMFTYFRRRKSSSLRVAAVPHAAPY
jgi:predicted PurR-regulated permease PerM